MTGPCMDHVTHYSTRHMKKTLVLPAHATPHHNVSILGFFVFFIVFSYLLIYFYSPISKLER